ncbi:hypothetical protein ACE1TI_05695 [Alteribacillus sp. JSM 102045]|uniref:hypothetical protein n=1 Tax=Alteribacillus sp. JSM 102045 TaxID=1562101 RepID=UPI0035BF1E41
MKRSAIIAVVGTLLCTSACQNDLSPDADDQAINQSSPSDYNQGPGNISMTTNKQTQGSDKDMVERIAKRHGFSPMYVTFGGRHAYLYVNADNSWGKKEKEQKLTELRKEYKQEIPRYEVNVQVMNE